MATTKRLLVITGATGTGKTSVQHYLRARYGIDRIITHTTRPQRTGEVDGRDYYFEDDASFGQNHFIEHVHYAGYQYGSSFEGLDRAFAQADVASIVLDTAGAITYVQRVRKYRVEPIFMTITDPSVLARRLQQRGDDVQMINQRIASAEFERDLALPPELVGKAHVVVNDDWDQARAAVDALLNTWGVHPRAGEENVTAS
ncbi:guanylate kinase [Lacticaseibacillus thailandensis]|uniref:Guanylate kinase n=1 Tax=Lacticaseibacillus thailandensis DSM 22698 = JCM 13996 TaxID=1423810 RepID=A0A0R2C860_9LACO|nr:AAA family ATPase [Lacticaseibacillus thailandensis]KRM87578.1 guanylate kinase [Lacticaseibacillus thailandensis DSM 22698 = JCM 13996]